MTNILDVVVVGGGLAGLTAAALLGRQGLSVEVLEKAGHLGGRGATEVRDGFCFNRGAHALLVQGEGQEILADLDVEVPGKVPQLGGFALRHGRLHTLPTGPLSLMTTGVVGMKDKAVLARWLGRLPKLRAVEHARQSVSEWLDSVDPGPAGRELLEAYVRVSTYTNRPDELSAETAIRQLQRGFAGGVHYIDGGWQTLVDGLAKRARAHGSAIQTGVRVTALRRDGTGLTRVEIADGRARLARAVVMAVEPDVASRLVESAGAPVPRGFRDRIVPRAATLDVALERLPRQDTRFVLGVDRPLYLSVHSATAALAPAGKALVQTIKYLDGDGGDPDADRSELEALLDLAQPGWRDQVVHSQFLPRMAVMERLDRASDGGAAGRPTPEIDGLPDVYVAGDWIQGGGWLCDSAFGSARRAALGILASLSRKDLARQVA